MRKFYTSFTHALCGLRFVANEERNFQIEVILGSTVLVLGIVFGLDLLSFAILVLTVILVLTAEAVNTAIEDIGNKISPKYDEAIGRIKDISAGFVLLSSVGALAVGLLVFAHHFLK